MKIVNIVKQLAEENSGDYMIFTPCSTKNYPLTNEQRLEVLREVFGDSVLSFQRFCDVINYIVDCEYESAIMVIGQDRLADFQRMLAVYEKESRLPIALSAISGGKRDASKAGIEGLSSSKMKDYVVQEQRYMFLNNLPETISANTALMLYNTMRNAK
jgi:hypothetical protein